MPNFTVKLFITEIYFLLLGFLALTALSLRHLSLFKDRLVLLLLLLLGFGLIRVAVEIGEGGMLVVRNSSFVWYLFLPLIVYFLPIRNRILEGAFRLTLLAVFTLFTISVFHFTFIMMPNYLVPKWSASFSIYSALACALIFGNKWSRAALFVIGVTFGSCFWSSYQRTTLVGCFFIAMVIFLLAWERRKLVLRNMGLFAVFFAVGVTFWPLRQHTVEFVREELPMHVYHMQIKYEAFKENLNKKLAANSLAKKLTNNAQFSVRKNIPRPTVRKKNELPRKQKQQSIAKHKNPFVKGDRAHNGLEKYRWQMWYDAFNKFANAPLLGIGYMPLVVHKVTTGDNIFLPNDGVIDNTPPISGPHNSYLNCMARLGAIGVLFLVLHIWAGLRLMMNGYYGAFFVIYSHILYSMFNVALEGPVRSVPLLLAMGLALRIPNRKSLLQFLDERHLLSLRLTEIKLANSFHVNRALFVRSIAVLALLVVGMTGYMIHSHEQKSVKSVAEFYALKKKISAAPSMVFDKQTMLFKNYVETATGRFGKYLAYMQLGKISAAAGKTRDSAKYFANAVLHSANNWQEAMALNAQAVQFEAEHKFDIAFVKYNLVNLLAPESSNLKLASSYNMLRLSSWAMHSVFVSDDNTPENLFHIFRTNHRKSALLDTAKMILKFPVRPYPLHPELLH